MCIYIYICMHPVLHTLLASSYTTPAKTKVQMTRPIAESTDAPCKVGTSTNTPHKLQQT